MEHSAACWLRIMDNFILEYEAKSNGPTEKWLDRSRANYLHLQSIQFLLARALMLQAHLRPR